MVLVDLTIDGGSSLFMACLDDGLVDNGGSDLLVHGGIIMARFGPRMEI